MNKRKMMAEGGKTEKKDPHEHLQYLLDEHEQLLAHMKDLNRWWTELDEHGLPKFGEMGTRVAGFRDLLAKHFEDEEQEGYFKPLMDEEPGFCIMVPDFQKKHAVTLSRFDDFIDRLKQSQPPFKNWSEAMREFDSLMSDIREHENREIRLVQEAFEKSVGD